MNGPSADEFTLYPERMIVESSSRCNYLCPLCLWTHNTRHGHLAPDTFRRFIETAAFRGPICFAGRGEPTLNPELGTILKISAEVGFTTDLATNGSSLLRDYQTLLDTGISAINVSIEADSAVDYIRYRVRGDFDAVVAGMRKLAGEKSRRNFAEPVLRTCSVLFGYNEDKIDRLRSFFASLGFEEFVFKSAHLGHGQLRASEDSLRDKWLPVNLRLRRAQFNVPPGAPATRCSFLRQAHILWNGDVCRCAIDHEAMVVGNVWEATFDDIWHGEKSQAVARRILEGRFSKCAGCSFSGRSRIVSGTELYVL
jgi:radical SAM protein with 4Fe4S-binding SPASM domain